MKNSLSASEIQQLLTKSTLVRSKFLTMNVAFASVLKIGFRVGSVLGPSVQRNLFKRRVRHILSLLLTKNNTFHVLISTKKLLSTYSTIEKEVGVVVKQILNKSGESFDRK